MGKIRNIIINFTATDRKNFVIADLPADLNGTPEKIFSDEFTVSLQTWRNWKNF